jgi:hypothetical protein
MVQEAARRPYEIAKGGFAVDLALIGSVVGHDFQPSSHARSV